MRDFCAYEINGPTTEGIQPSASENTRFIGFVEAENLEDAYELALRMYGSPVAVE